MRSSDKNIIKLYRPEIVSALICVLLGITSGLSVKAGESIWYTNLLKPSFNPPNWIFGPVWTVLYIMMGIAHGKIWKLNTNNKKQLGAFYGQFVFNLAWSPLFFYFQRIDLAFLDICLLWFSLGFLMFSVRHNKQIFILLVPYFVWVSFALFLNYNLLIMN